MADFYDSKVGCFSSRKKLFWLDLLVSAFSDILLRQYGIAPSQISPQWGGYIWIKVRGASKKDQQGPDGTSISQIFGKLKWWCFMVRFKKSGDTNGLMGIYIHIYIFNNCCNNMQLGNGRLSNGTWGHSPTINGGWTNKNDIVYIHRAGIIPCIYICNMMQPYSKKTVSKPISKMFRPYKSYINIYYIYIYMLKKFSKLFSKFSISSSPSPRDHLGSSQLLTDATRHAELVEQLIHLAVVELHDAPAQQCHHLFGGLPGDIGIAITITWAGRHRCFSTILRSSVDDLEPYLRNPQTTPACFFASSCPKHPWTFSANEANSPRDPVPCGKAPPIQLLTFRIDASSGKPSTPTRLRHRSNRR